MPANTKKFECYSRIRKNDTDKGKSGSRYVTCKKIKKTSIHKKKVKYSTKSKGLKKHSMSTRSKIMTLRSGKKLFRGNS